MSKNRYQELNVFIISVLLSSDSEVMKYPSWQNKNKFVTRGAQFLLVGIPTICLHNLVPNII